MAIEEIRSSDSARQGPDSARSIREELDKVRRALDAIEHAPLSPPSRRRWAYYAAAGLVAVLLIVAAGLASYRYLARDDTASATPSGAAPSPAAGPAGASPSGSAGEVPGSGPGISEPGTYLRFGIVDGTDLDVFESTVLTDAPAKLTLDSRPTGSDGDALRGPTFTTLAPRVVDLQVTVDGQVAKPTPGLLRSSGGAATWSVPVPDGGKLVQLRYRVIGAVARSVPSTTGRILAVVTPVTAAPSLAAGDPIVVQTGSPEVMGMTCLGAPTKQQLCGLQSGTTWSAALPPGSTSPTVVVQADLATP